MHVYLVWLGGRPTSRLHCLLLMFPYMPSCYLGQIFRSILILLPFCQSNLTCYLRGFITFTYQNTYDVFLGILLQLLEPLADIIESCPPSQIEHNQGTSCSFVVSMCDGSEALLSCCVPNLRFYFMVFDGYAFSGELDTNRGFGLDAELITLEPGQKVGFADCGIWSLWNSYLRLRPF